MVVSKVRARIRHCRSVSQLKRLHAQALTLGLLPIHQPTACDLLNCYSRLDNQKEAQQIFTSIPNPDIISWTCLITLFLNSPLPSSAISAFSSLLLSTPPDSFSTSAAISACSRSLNLPSGMSLHSLSIKFNLLSLPPVPNSLIHFYSTHHLLPSSISLFNSMPLRDPISWSSMLFSFILSGRLSAASRFFLHIPHLNSVSWTTLMTGFVRSKSPAMALTAFRSMISLGRDMPTVMTLVLVISGCRDIGALHTGRCIHGYVNRFGVEGNVAVGNSLVDLYAKCGCLEDACKVFDEMSRRDVISWTCMIFALALHGEGEGAVGVFSEMVESGVCPNEATFTAVMLACSHGGMVVEGMETFERMRRSGEVGVAHYGCVVDVLCRKGLLEEAKGFIERMPVEPDAAVWRSFLSGCLAHDDVALAETVLDRVVEEHAEDGELHVLLCNIFRFHDKREDASCVRKKMGDLKLRKMVGSSWVQTGVL